MGKRESNDEIDEVDVWTDPDLARIRRGLEGERLASRPGVPFTLSAGVIALYGSSRGIANERDLVEYFIDFANGKTIRSARRTELRSNKGSFFDPEGRPIATTAEQKLKIDDELIGKTRARHREFLASVIRDRLAVNRSSIFGRCCRCNARPMGSR
jgi:hypothetical protein